jgi:hypothetical protein
METKMKFLKLLIIILATTNLALANTPSQGPIVTNQEKNEILEIIDRTCADTWCAGDNEFKFNSFNCNDEKFNCLLTFQIIDDNPKSGSSKIRNRRCFFYNIKSSKELLIDHRLTDSFYDKLNTCISNRESN